jgi:hypothetical protein
MAQQFQKRRPVSIIEMGDGLFHRPFMICERAAYHFAAGSSKPDNARTPVSRIVPARHQALALQPVDRRRNRAARQKNLGSQFVDRERAFVQQRFEDSEIAQTHPQGNHARLGKRFERPSSLPEHEPQVNTANHLDIKMLDIKEKSQLSRDQRERSYKVRPQAL